MRKILFVFVMGIMFCSCHRNSEIGNIEQYKSELFAVEKEFAQMAKSEGVMNAFLTFAADDATINRADKLYTGKDAIEKFFENQTLKNIELDWTPEFADVSASGDLGYTYGNYMFSAINSNGDTIQAVGIFHTVWKKQSDGNWRFVWD